MKLNDFFPTDKIGAMKWLGTKKWLQLVIDPNGEKESRYNILTSALRPTEDDLQRFTDDDFENGLEIVQGTKIGTLSQCMYTHTLCVAVADGIKLFQPSFEQCLVIENTKVTIPFAEYVQPFPVVVIELPEEYRRHLSDNFEHENVPSYVFAYRHESGFVTCTAWFNSNDAIVLNASPLKKYKTLEDSIVANSAEAKFAELVEKFGEEYAKNFRDHLVAANNENLTDYSVAEVSQRLALNFSYALATLGTTRPRPLNAAAHQKNLAIVRNKRANPRKKARAQRFLNGTVYTVAFEQEITISPDVAVFANAYRGGSTSASDKENGGKRRFVKPHFRRGHWREQACGTGFRDRKRVLIDPVLVNKKFFLGDLSDTFVSMKIEGDLETA